MSDYNNDDNNEYTKLKRLNRLQTLTMIGLIGGPVSLLIGGLLLSVISIVCAIVAFVGLNRIDAKNQPSGSIERRLYLQAAVAVAICIFATTLNLYFFVSIVSAFMDAQSSGTLDGFIDSIMTGSVYEQEPTGSIWDR